MPMTHEELSHQAEKACCKVGVCLPGVGTYRVTFQKVGCLVLLNVQVYQLTGIPILKM